MKKTIWGFTALSLLAALATSCNKDIVEAKGDGEKTITYGINTGKQTLTRAQEMTTGLLQAASGTTPVIVNAYNDAGTLYNNTPFSLVYAATPVTPFGNWVYNSGAPEVHPNFGLYHYSTVPTQTYTVAGTVGSGTAPAVTFDYVADQDEDLIAAFDGPTTNASATAAKATLTYDHLLSQINFAVVGLEDYQITISNISINDVKNAGTYTFPSGANLAAWSAQDGTGTYSYPYTPGTDPTTDGLTIVYLTETEDAPGTENTWGLMLMPQVLETGATFTFDYEIGYTPEGGDYIKFDGGTATVDLSNTNLATTEWKAGLRYLYVINFESPIFITYEVAVNGWEDTDENNIDIDTDNNDNGEENPDDGVLPGIDFPVVKL